MGNERYKALKWHNTYQRKKFFLFTLNFIFFKLQILVWHTQTKKNAPAAAVDLFKYNNTNILKLKDQLV